MLPFVIAPHGDNCTTLASDVFCVIVDKVVRDNARCCEGVGRTLIMEGVVTTIGSSAKFAGDGISFYLIVGDVERGSGGGD